MAVKTILFVDDEQSLALLGVDLLEEYDYEVTSAFDGEEAFKKFQQSAGGYDLVITDESMPGISGLELAQQLFIIAPAVPVIICSGHMLTMEEKGMDKTNIVNVLLKTEVCTRLPGMIATL